VKVQFDRLNKVFEVEIPGKVGIKKNSRQLFQAGSRKVSAPSKRYKAWESGAFPSVLRARAEFRESLPIDQPIFAYFEFHFLNRRGLPDTSNCIEGPQDLLQSLGIFTNDQLIEHLEAVRIVGSKPKTIIKLFTGRMTT
jgi:Holliday junction resolvase RusA-like endonuclease